MTVRRAFALAELLVAVVVIALIGGAIAAGLRRQQQVFRSIAVMTAARGDARDAGEVLAADLSSASPIDTLALAVDSAVEFFSLVGASVSCDSAPGYVIRMPPEKLKSGRRLTTLLAAPDSGDVVLVLDRTGTGAAGEPRWDRHSVAAVSAAAAASTCPFSTGFTTAADQSASAYSVTLAGAASDAIPRGAPVRILRRTRYSLYRASDSRWYLGQRRCAAPGPSACGSIQPVSGPYMPYATAGQSGIALRYLDSGAGAVWAPGGSSGVALVEITVRTRGRAPVQLGGTESFQFLDSAAFSVALRNRD